MRPRTLTGVAAGSFAGMSHISADVLLAAPKMSHSSLRDSVTPRKKRSSGSLMTNTSLLASEPTECRHISAGRICSSGRR